MRFVHARPGTRPGVGKTVVVASLVLLSAVHIAIAFQLTSAEFMWIGQYYGSQLLVPSNQVLTLSGSRFEVPGWPVDLAFSPAGNQIALLLEDGIQLTTRSGALIRRIPLSKSSFAGLAFTADGHVVAGQLGRTDTVISADPSTGQVAVLSSFPAGSIPTGIASSITGGTIFVALNGANSVAEIDAASRTVINARPAGVAPFGVALTPDETKLFVSNWGGRQPRPGDPTALSDHSAVVIDRYGIASSGTVSVFDAASLTLLKEIPVGLHPSAMQVSPDGSLLAVANANSDSIMLIDTVTLEVLDTIPIPAFPQGYRGSSPTAVAFSPTGKWLYVACGGNNAVAVLERTQGGAFSPSGPVAAGATGFRLSGYVPVDWYPVALGISQEPDGGETVFAANAKGVGSRKGTGKFNVHGVLGTVVSFAGGARSMNSAAVASDNSPFTGSAAAAVIDLKSLGIDHVFYIIKENRTYDQILGDLGRGNGDPSLTQYGWTVTPNHHHLAQDFVTLDNYYSSGVTSADGHQWLTQSFVTDYLERAFGRWARSYPFAGNDPLAFASTGFIWDNAQRTGLSVRVFGEFTAVDSGGERSWLDYYTDAMAPKQTLTVMSHTSIASMNPIVESTYPGWALNIPDVFRARIFRDKLKAFERSHNLPNLVILFLPADHTAGMLHGYPKPASMVADNDLALGQIVDAISHSVYWPRSAIFVTEDDSQDGVDHVDGHRTVGLVISPFVKRGRVESAHYNQTSMIRTIEELLGMPPMNKFDAAALPMLSLFTNEPNYRTFSASLNEVRLDDLTASLDKLDTPEKAAALESMAMDFTHPDAAPEDRLNRILWQISKGWDKPYPKIPHRWGCQVDADD